MLSPSGTSLFDDLHPAEKLHAVKRLKIIIFDANNFEAMIITLRRTLMLLEAFAKFLCDLCLVGCRSVSRLEQSRFTC